MMTRRITIIFGLIACLLVLPMGMSAQRLRITLYHTGEGGKKVAAQNVPVYSFLVEGQARRAQELLKQYEKPNKRSGHSDEGKTDKSGQIDLMGRPEGFLLIDAGNYIFDENSAILLPISKLSPKADASGAIFTISYTIPDGQKKSVDGIRTTNMEEANVVMKMVSKKKPSTKAIINGKDVTFKFTVYIDSAYARNDARFVISPFLVVPDENNDTVGFFLPHVVDGEDYNETMVRRMGNDLKHDKLQPYREHVIDLLDLYGNKTGRSRYMRLRKNGMFEFSQLIRNFDYTRHYNSLGHIWYEDYNNVYFQDVVHLWSGNFINYNRYLDWSSAKTDIDLDASHYERIGKAESTPHTQSYQMAFEIGKAQLNLNDSATIHEIARLKGDIARVYDATDDSYMATDTIRGYASPDGNVASNATLARNRATFLYNQVLRPAFPNTRKFPTPHIDSKIAPWTEVADTLEVMGDSLSQRIASEIRTICKSTSGLDRQGVIISQQPWYKNYLLPKVLPRLRRDEFIYRSVTFAVRTPDEIYNLYQTDPNYRAGKTQRDYEYYELMNRLYTIKDYEGLERIARKALQSPDLQEDVTRTDTLGSKRDSLGEWHYIFKPETPVYKRSYPLAAYYLAKCLLHRGAVDTKLLNGYLDYSLQGRPNLKKNFEQEERGYWNEEAIVLAQVMMLCQDNDYTQANFVMDDHLPEDDPRFTKLRVFLRALKGDYDDPQVRDTVAVSSPMNFLVAWCGYADAADDPSGYQMAMNLINGNMEPILKYYPDIKSQWGDIGLDQDDPRVMYVKAICRYKTECPKILQKDDAPLMQSQYIYDASEIDKCWAYTMLESLQKDKSNVAYLKTDGTFNDSYRTLVLYFYERLQQGASMQDIKNEYDELRKKYITTEQK